VFQWYAASEYGTMTKHASSTSESRYPPIDTSSRAADATAMAT
jgi:hypothetical protein